MKRNYTNPAADLQYRSLMENISDFPFSFVYNGETYRGFGADAFALKEKQCDAADGRETARFVWDFRGELDVILSIVYYPSHGATEWTVAFENPGQKNSGVIEEPKACITFDGKYPTLKGILGDHVNFYRPYAVDLTDNFIEFSSDSGRATHINFPYFNLEHGDGGTMLAIGWAGTWKAQFSSDGEKTTYSAGAVNNLRTYLKPGESIRTALFVFAPYTVRNEHYATNYWRDWFVRYNLPKADKEGAPLTPFSTVGLSIDTGRTHSDGSISETYETWRPSLEKLLAEDIHADFRWMDAGWYIAPDLGSAEPFVKGHDWWDTVGTWEFDPVKWPGKTFLESTDFAREHGMKTLMWFEPERITDLDNMVKNFGYKREWGIRMPGVGWNGRITICNNIGDPECRKWTTERICKVLRENKIEMYREDNNCNASKLWELMDGMEGENRQGITESKFIMGHYAMWDDFIACTKSFGGCGFVDSCASGGGRNDLESMRRGIPLMRSDYDRYTITMRLAMTTALNRWIPFNGAASMCDNGTKDAFHVGAYDKYSFRGSYLPTFNLTNIKPTQDPNTDFESLRFGFGEWNKVKPYLLSEFYVLTPWRENVDNSDFTAYCFFDPEREEGYLFAFRLPDCVREDLTVVLPFAGGDAYSLTDEDSGETIVSTGRLDLSFAEPRSSRLFAIRKA